MSIDDPTEPELDKTIHVDMDATLGLPTEGERGSSSASPTPGRQFGQYELHEELGRGGQGVVIRATDTRFDRTVAVKILSGLGPGSEGVLERFRREAAVVARLDHPGMCTVYDAGTIDGIPFIAMRFVDGESLADRIQQLREQSVDGDQPLESTARNGLFETVGIIEQAARTLHAAHEARIVHRDVKPGNIMVAGNGDCVVMDFGLARDDASGDHTLTRTGDLLGTPAYMSPEQLNRAPHELDARTDIWSLGATLYEAVTLKRPFEGHTREALYHEILTREPRAPRQSTPAIPRDLQTVITTALEKTPDARYQSALEFAEDLRRVRNREPIRARPVGPAGRLWRWAARNPAIAALSVTIFVGLSLGVILLAIRGEELRSLNTDLQSSITLERKAHAETKAVRESFHQLFSSFFYDDPAQRKIARDYLARWCENLATEAPSMDRAHRHYSAGLAYFALGEAGEAETQWRAAITIYRDLDPEGHLLAATLLHVADGLASRNYEGPLTEVEALAMLEEARAIFTRIYGANSQEVGVVDGTLVSIRNQQTTPTKGFVLKPFWVSYLWQLENKDRPESEKRTKDEIRSAVLKSLTIVKSAWKEGRDEDAHRELRSWLDRYLKQNATVARMVPIGVDRAAEEARKHGEGDLAAALSMEALSIARELYGQRHSTTLYHKNRHSIILGDFGHRDEAIAGLEESLRVARDALSPGHDIILTALDHLAVLRSTGGDLEAARGHMTELMEMTLAHVSVADANFLYAFARRARFECDENGGEPGGAPAAIPWIEQLVTHLRDADPRPVKRLAEAYLLLGEWQLAAGQPDAAREQIALLRKTLGDKKRLPRKSLRARLAALEKSVGPGREERRE